MNPKMNRPRPILRDGVYQYTCRSNASHHDRIQQHVRFLDDSPDVSVVTGGATVGETSQNQDYLQDADPIARHVLVLPQLDRLTPKRLVGVDVDESGNFKYKVKNPMGEHVHFSIPPVNTVFTDEQMKKILKIKPSPTWTYSDYGLIETTTLSTSNT